MNTWGEAPLWLKGLLPYVGTLGLGGIIVELLRRWKSRADLREVNARADKAEAEGGATALSAVGAAFGELAKHMQHELSDLRDRCARLEEQLNAAQAMVARLEAQNAKLEGENDRLTAENERLTGRNEQLAGENRQLKQVMESAKRMANGAPG